MSDEVITVGRGAENIIRIEDPSVSGRHAEFYTAGAGYHVRDIGSTNGTRVNGQTITDISLRPGDRIVFGRVEACYECDAESAQPLPQLEQITSQPADTSARPVDFGNASPFRTRTKDRDPSRQIIFAATAVALLAFVASMIAVLTLHPPSQ